ncbi:MAG: N-acetylneuraminate synthase family protein [Acidobacteriota bacterium]
MAGMTPVSRPIVVGNRRIGPGEPCYVIAEAGSNHDGSLEQAYALIGAAADAGVDAVKFQAIKYDELWVRELETAEHQAFYSAIELPEAWLPQLARAAADRGIHFLCSPTYLRSVRLIDEAGAPAFKIASPQAVGDPLILRAVAATGKPAILSTGYAAIGEIARAVRVLEEANCAGLAMLQCVAEYPSPAARINLRAMEMLSRRFHCAVGLSDHSPGIHIAPAAVAIGACLVEKHFTTDRRRPGPDHHFALEPGELKDMVAHIRDVEAAMGDGGRDTNTVREREQITRLEVRAIARAPIAAGARIAAADVIFRRAPDGLSAYDFEALEAPVAAEPIAARTPITRAKLRGGSA